MLKCSSSVHKIRNFDVDLQNTLKIISKKYASIRMNKIYRIFTFKKRKIFVMKCINAFPITKVIHSRENGMCKDLLILPFLGLHDYVS